MRQKQTVEQLKQKTSLKDFLQKNKIQKTSTQIKKFWYPAATVPLLITSFPSES